MNFTFTFTCLASSYSRDMVDDRVTLQTPLKRIRGIFSNLHAQIVSCDL